MAPGDKAAYSSGGRWRFMSKQKGPAGYDPHRALSIRSVAPEPSPAHQLPLNGQPQWFNCVHRVDTRPYTASTRADEDPAFPKIRSISVAAIRLFPPMVLTTRSFPSRSHRWMVVRCTPSRLAASPALNIFPMMINYIRK